MVKGSVDLRNEDEHPKSKKAFIQGYNIQLQPNGKYFVESPKFLMDILF